MKPSEKEQQFLEMLRTAKNQVYRVCWGFASNSSDVDDLFQEVNLRLWQNIESFRGEAAISTWVYRITVNTCILWKREKGRQLKLREQADPPIVLPDAPKETPERIKRLRAAIQKLKEADRTIILLVLEGCSYKEIAEITGLSQSNVGAKISRIKARLKKQITDGKF